MNDVDNAGVANVIFSLAPMEGLTGYVFRTVHAACFGALDRYYTPFLTPPRLGFSFDKRYAKELDSARNRELGLDVVPQLLTKDADQFVWASKLLAEMGYREVNLNLGCPSGTVTAKGKGSGFLRDLEALGAFLDDICGRSALPVSVKTRIGVRDDAEYEKILELYRRFPLAELIVHPRVQKDFYQGKPRWEPYGATLARAPFPVAYNGDIFAPGDFAALMEAYPQTRHVMLGRGIVANPALARMIAGGPSATRAELERFHDRLYRAYERDMGPNAVFHMKEWWSCVRLLFENPDAVHRAVRGVRKVDDYLAAVEKVFREERLADGLAR